MLYEELDEVQRRRFLQAGGQLASALLTLRVPTGGGPPASGELLDAIAGDLAALRRAEARDGAIKVLGPAIKHADHLVRTLATSGDRQRRPVAELAAEAAYLTGGCTRDQGDVKAGLAWYRVAVRAADAADDADVQAIMRTNEAWAVHLLGDDPSAKAMLDHLPMLARATPTARGYVELHRAELLAIDGREDLAWRAFDRAAQAWDQATAGEAQRWLWWFAPGPTELDRWAGRVEVAAGYGEAAYERLQAAARRLPRALWRDSGGLHLRMAKAAALTGDKALAVEHVDEADRVYTATRSTLGIRRLAVVRRQLAVKFDDQSIVDRRAASIGDGHRYVTTRTYNSRRRRRLHQADCPTLARGPVSRATPWPAGDGREPADLVANQELRPGLDVCEHCMSAGR